MNQNDAEREVANQLVNTMRDFGIALMKAATEFEKFLTAIDAKAETENEEEDKQQS